MFFRSCFAAVVVDVDVDAVVVVVVVVVVLLLLLLFLLLFLQNMAACFVYIACCPFDDDVCYYAASLDNFSVTTARR